MMNERDGEGRRSLCRKGCRRADTRKSPSTALGLPLFPTTARWLPIGNYNSSITTLTCYTTRRKLRTTAALSHLLNHNGSTFSRTVHHEAAMAAPHDDANGELVCGRGRIQEARFEVREAPQSLLQSRAENKAPLQVFGMLKSPFVTERMTLSPKSPRQFFLPSSACHPGRLTTESSACDEHSRSEHLLHLQSGRAVH